MNDQLIEELAGFSHDPLGFVYYAFPWGEGELAGKNLEAWQAELLSSLGKGVISVEDAILQSLSTDPIQHATTSGHGVGKSALVAMIIWWAVSTFPDTRGIVTANTENQLKTKTWVEVAKWYRLFIGRSLFRLTATAIFSVDPEHEKTWRIDMVPWSEKNTEAFAGMHNQGKRILVIFDEGSSIPDIIWEVTEGALTDQDTQIIWAVFGNPTRSRGRFRECFEGGRFSHRWHSHKVDSRTVTLTNKKQIADWIADYGEDSDFVRIRILGIFPRIDAETFIPLTLCQEAIARELVKSSGPLILGVDVGRKGSDPSVIYPRRGRDARTHLPQIIQSQDTMVLVSKVVEVFRKLGADLVMVDGGGVGGGVVDRLRQLHIPVIEVDFGSAGGTNPDDGTKYANKRAAIWGACRTWLRTGCIPEIKTGEFTTLADELSGPNYGYNKKEEILLESKQDMKNRGVPSPNCADALCCTFAFPDFEIEPTLTQALGNEIKHEYDPFSQEFV